MKFCTKCGKQLADGEVCSCQEVQAENVQPIQPQVAPQPTPQPAPKKKAGMPGFLKEIFGLFPAIFKKPADAVVEFVKAPSLLAPGTIILVFGFLAACMGGLTEAVDWFARKAINGYASSVVKMMLNMVGGFCGSLIIEIGGAVAMAALIMVLLNALEKNKKVTFAQGLAIAAMGTLVSVPFALIGSIIGMIPLSFFSVIDSCVASLGSVVGCSLMFIGIKSVEDDDNHLPIVYGVSAFVVAIIRIIMVTYL